ncbi:MAG: SRPBCC domain-containing protein [Betaproteobacteria bacterium]|nr:SRPBCC domain-containing protein [Betaproteobacteria bacterium]
MPDNVQKRDLSVTRVFDAPVQLVWEAWSDPNYVMRWWGPDHFTCPSAKIDFREGGTSIVCMRAPKEFRGADTWSIWVYRKIVPLQSIEFIQSLSDAHGNPVDPVALGMPPEFPREMRTLVSFRKLGADKTEMTVTQFDWTVSPMLGYAEAGLNQSLDKMVMFIHAAGAGARP